VNAAQFWQAVSKATLFIESADAMERLGACLAPGACAASSIWLQGDLGAGKTTLCRGFIRALGYRGRVKSPSYTLLESYSTARFPVHHFDFYRIADSGEVEWIGIRDYFDDEAVCLVEWPERAGRRLPPPALRVDLAHAGDGRRASLHAEGNYELAAALQAFRRG